HMVRFPSCAAFVQCLEESKCNDTVHASLAMGCGHAASVTGLNLTATMQSYLTADLLRPRLAGFCRRWQGQVFCEEKHKFVFRIKTPRGFWQRWLGRRPGLEISIHWQSAADAVGMDVTMTIAPHDSGRTQGREALEVIGSLLIEGLRDHLQSAPRRRGQERVP